LNNKNKTSFTVDRSVFQTREFVLMDKFCSDIYRFLCP